ncbi:hypothetical protein Q0L85_14210, partial [Staphylococcus aureus]|nr:hypothetical protein [Staphylococcus aureus]
FILTKQSLQTKIINFPAIIIRVKGIRDEHEILSMAPGMFFGSSGDYLVYFDIYLSFLYKDG